MRKILSFFETAKDTTTTILWLLGIGAMLGTIGLAFEKWFSGLSILGVVSFYVLAGCLLLMMVTLILNWKQKRDIERIPDLIEKLEVLVSNYVDDFELTLTKDDWLHLYDDYEQDLGIDLSGIKKILASGERNKTALTKEYEKIDRAYSKKLDFQTKTEQALTDLGDMSSILDGYKAGLRSLKDTPQYKKLEKQIKSLQRKAPSAYISVKVNEYFVLSERLHYMVLGTKPLYSHPELRDIMPAKIKAKKSQIRPIVDGQIANLIAGVREAIVKYKERNLEQKGNIEKQTDTPINRAERRHGSK
jgi:hypothetical protein